MKYIRLTADDPGGIYAVPDDVADHLNRYAHSFYAWLETSKQAKAHRQRLPNGETMLLFNEQDFADYLRRKCHECTLILDLSTVSGTLPGENRDIPTYHF